MALDYKNSLSRYRRYLQVVKEQPLWQASLWVVLSLILLIVLVVFALRPTLVTIASLFGQIDKQEEIASRLDEKIQLVQNANEKLRAIRPRLELLDQAMPVGNEWAKYAQRFLDTATESGLEVTDLTFEGITVSGLMVGQKNTSLPPGFFGLNFSFVGKGDFDQVTEFLDIVENWRRVTVLSGVRLDKQLDGSLSVVIRGMAVYSQDENI